MEVDDSELTPEPTEAMISAYNTRESEDSPAAADKNGRTSGTGRRAGRRSLLKAIKIVKEEEDEQIVTEEVNAEVDNESSFELIIPDKELEEFSESGAMRSKDDKYTMAHLDAQHGSLYMDQLMQDTKRSQLIAEILKRKQYKLQRSNSEEYFLGFDEVNGEPHMAKHNPDEEKPSMELEAKEEHPHHDSGTDGDEKPHIEELALIAAAVSHQEPSIGLYDATTPETDVSMSPQAKRQKMSSTEPAPQTAIKNSPQSEASPANTPSIHKNKSFAERAATAISPPSGDELLPEEEDDEEREERPVVNEHIVAADNENLEPAAFVISTIQSAARNTAPTNNANNTLTKKPLSAKDEFYKKPFAYGWKRELVYRANMESSKDKADVYFITPAGKKLRTRNDIIPQLEGDLTIDHFSFAREPLGVGPELETVRSAKPTNRASIAAATLAAAAPTPAHLGKRVSKPKGPKGASPPPEGWTPTRALKTNNAALLSSAGSSKYSVYPATPPHSRHVHHSNSNSSKSSKTRKPLQGNIAEADKNAFPRAATAQHEPCTMLCAQACGQLPQLQCIKCLCLYHHECVGLSRKNCEYRIVGEATLMATKEYVCESCVPQNDSLTSPTAPITTTTTTTIAAASTASSLSATLAPSKETTKAATAPLVAAKRASGASKQPTAFNKLPQSIAVVKGKKYVMVAKPHAPKAHARSTNIATAEQLNDIENDLKQINESIRNSRKQSSASLDAAFQPNHAGADLAQKSFATNFFANVSFAYDALLCILKYLKIHERPRAAAVCKLWNLAAKDTSLWQTVRMKNSKISNWSGFAAALRRGETKHLDLRKMLFSSSRVDEMWADFCTYIGTVYSLESIDLCRCSAKVVESLFLSNPQLRVLNALLINDDSYSLQSIAKLTKLSELRLRTCEPGTLDGDLLPLKALTTLTHLSLTSLLALGTKSIEVLGELRLLRSLELGECGDFDATFAQTVLPRLRQLQRLRLENGTKTSCCTLQILDAVAKLPQLSQLEFVNFDIKPGFDEKLVLCSNIRKLLIIPTYISQSATTNQIVLYAVQQIADTLEVFTWGVTVELLRVTALYVDQCEDSAKKEKHHFDECIPVMKPVPGAPPDDAQDDAEGNHGETENMHDSGSNAVPQIEILPLDKVEAILGDNLSNTKFTIVKVPYQATCKQHLVE